MNAYVTLADSIEYLKCAYALALSLQKAQSIYPLIIMIPENSIEYNDFPIVKNTKIVSIPLLMFNAIDATADFNTTINKFFSLQQQYEKIIFLDADIYIYSNFDFLFNYTFPLINLDKNEIRGGIFGLKADNNLLSFIINLAIRYTFSNDEQILAYLFNQHYLPIGTLIEINDKIYHDAGYPKMWSKYNYQDIEKTIINNQVNFNIAKSNKYHKIILQENYMNQIIERIKQKYEST